MTSSGSDRRAVWVPVVALAAVIYPPLLLTAPGTVVADTKSYLYLDPGRLLERALSMWDPSIGMGTVPHQQIGFLWPIGPYYWVMETIGVPDWVAQRFWLGSILVVAGAGVLHLARTWRWRTTAAVAAAFVYALTPFVLTLAPRLSVILLPFAGLPWLLALTIRALRTRGWRHPAAFALVVATIGSVNATALLLVGLVPVGWIIYAFWTSTEVTRSRAVSTLMKMGVLTLAVNLWWIGGLSVQATNGLDVLRYSERAQTVADASSAPEVLRGLGYWFFYGGDRLQLWMEASYPYTQNLLLLGLTYAIPIVGLLALGVTRWRHRTFVIAMLGVGTILAVGAHPWDDPSPLGAAIKTFMSADVGLAMRSLPRAVPLVALATALGIGSLVGAVAEQVPRRGLYAMVLTVGVAIAALPPLRNGDLVPDNLSRPETLPDHWEDAAAHLDDGNHETRVLEIPGIDFASYRWGNTVDPVTPGLMDRPYVARELVPNGSAASADLLNALDRALQEQTLPPDALAIVARLMNVGDIVTRNDLQYERYNTARPRTVWDTVKKSTGLGDPTPFGPSTPNDAVDIAPLHDEQHLARDAALADPPAVGVFPVSDPVPIVHTHDPGRMVLLSGDGAGIVDAAAAGLIDGDELIRYSADVTADPDFLRDQLVDERFLVVTDTNRARGQRWSGMRHDQGYTEQAGGGLLETDAADNRLPVFQARPGIQSVAVHDRVSARASDYGEANEYEPDVRPFRAVDGDPTTAWVVGTFGDPAGERIELTTDDAVDTDRITLLQPSGPDFDRRITQVALRFDGGDPMTVDLDERSLSAPGQTVRFDPRSFEQLSIEILSDSSADAPESLDLSGVGFAEIDLGIGPGQEFVRMPTDLLEAGGFRTLRYPLALLQTRQRTAATEVNRSDEEFALARIVDLPTRRSYGLSGTVRLSGRAATTIIDQIVGRTEGPTVTASSTLPGGLRHLPANVLDGDDSTWWTSAFGPATDAPSVTTELGSPTPVPEIAVTHVDDALHSTPGAAVIRADGREVARSQLSTGDGEGLRETTIPLPAGIVATSLTVEFVGVEPRTTIDWQGADERALPVAIASVDIPGIGAGPVDDMIDSGCRNDLLTLDDVPIPVRVTGTTASALDGGPLALQTCDGGPVVVPGGERRVEAAEGRATGFDVDQLVWCSVGGGDACDDPTSVAAAEPSPGPRVEVLDDDRSTVRVALTGARAGEPFWLVLGESYNNGWEIVDDDIETASVQLVDGAANGFLITPQSSAFELEMRFTPQNRVEIGLLLSVVGVIIALALTLAPARSDRPVPIPLQEPVRRIRALTWEGALPTRRDAVTVGVLAGVAAGLVVMPLIGVGVGLVAGLATRRDGWRPLFTLAPAILLAICGLYVVAIQYRDRFGAGLPWPQETGGMHVWALLAVVLLVVDVLIDQVWARRSDFR